MKRPTVIRHYRGGTTATSIAVPRLLIPFVKRRWADAEPITGVERVVGGMAFGVTINGSPFQVGVGRLEMSGERIDPPRFYGRELKL